MMLKTIIGFTWQFLTERATAAFDTFTVRHWGFGEQTWGSMIGSIIGTLRGGIVFVSGAVFLIGALLFAMSGVNEQFKSTGKTMMIAGLTSLAVVVGALSILRAVSYFIWGG